VEEAPGSDSSKPKKSRKTDATPNASDRVKMDPANGPFVEGDIGKDEEEDDTDEDEDDEEEEKFDIDDTSPEAALAAAESKASSPTSSSPVPRGHNGNNGGLEFSPSSSASSDHELHEPTSLAQRAASLIAGDKVQQAHSSSGIESPGRFVVPVPHPPRVHSRHLVDSSHHHHHLGNVIHSSGLHHPRPQTQRNQPQHSHLHLPQQHPSYDVSESASSSSVHSPVSSSSALSSARTPRPNDQQQRHSQNLSPPSKSVHLAAPSSAGLVGQTKKQHAAHRRGRSMGDSSATATATKRTAFAVYGHDETDSE